MSTSKFASPKLIAVAVVGLLAIGGAVWGLAIAKRGDTNVDAGIPKELTADALKKATPEQGMDAFRKAMDRDDLTDEQRQKIMENGREAMEKRMDERINEYFSAPNKEEKRKILDKQIDEFEKMRKEREERDAERDKKSEEEREKDRERWKNMRQKMENMSQGERKSRSESRSPDKQARSMTYRQAVQARMQERGIEPPKFGPGGPGGGGPRGGGGERPPKP